MFRVKMMASTIPLLLVGAVAGGEIIPTAKPCIALGRASVQIATAPWQNQFHVSFTNDPAAATVRVQLVDSAESADFAVVDDKQTEDADSCNYNSETSFVGIADHVSASEPVILLTQESRADFRIFVRSRTFSAKDAAALVVAARNVRPALRESSAL